MEKINHTGKLTCFLLAGLLATNLYEIYMMSVGAEEATEVVSHVMTMCERAKVMQHGEERNSILVTCSKG